MRLFGKFAFSSMLVAGTVFLTACPSQTSVSQINADPARYKDKKSVSWVA
jgi:hypothetical protein